MSLRSILLAAALSMAVAPGLPAQLALSCSQPCGNGSFEMMVTGAAAWAELYNLINLTPYSPTGGGPIFGLGMPGSDLIFVAITSPLGTDPFHVNASGSGTYNWFFCNPPLIPPVLVPADLVSVEFGPGGYVDHTSVVYYQAWL